jgi:hypothetical protein
MLEYPEIHEDYASYASIRDDNCVGYTCLNANDFDVLLFLVRTTSWACRTKRLNRYTGRSSPRKSRTAWRRRTNDTSALNRSSIRR